MGTVITATSLQKAELALAWKDGSPAPLKLSRSPFRGGSCPLRQLGARPWAGRAVHSLCTADKHRIPGPFFRKGLCNGHILGSSELPDPALPCDINSSPPTPPPHSHLTRQSAPTGYFPSQFPREKVLEFSGFLLFLAW